LIKWSPFLRLTSFWLLVSWLACQPADPALPPASPPPPSADTLAMPEPPDSLWHQIAYDVPLEWYLEYLDTLVAAYDSLLSYPINEHLIVLSNPWLIDTLAHTDYYWQMERGHFIYDPQAMLALRAGDRLLIPDSLQAAALRQRLAGTILDINIPEFKLRIRECDSLLFTFPVRVGQHRTKYLAMAGREVDLHTRTGTGAIIRVNRDPIFINPADNRIYNTTGRDDGRRTKLPRVPWLEPELNGHRPGQLIHPTTNPATLGKAYSNGCIGVREGDMWRIYYHAPLGTPVIVRYDLEVLDSTGQVIRLPDIYRGQQHQASLWPGQPARNLAATSGADCFCHLGK
jgi:L,D-transpeptidase ErfK/SrfK